MGSSLSSSAGDRRNNALRRSQRKSLTGTCSGIDKVLKSLKNFKGTIDSPEYEKMKLRIIQIDKNMQQKVQEVHPQFKTIHNIARQKIDTAYGILEQKARENTDFSKTQNVILNGDGIKPSSPGPSKVISELSFDENSNTNNAEVDIAPPQSPTPQSPTEGHKRNSLLFRLSKLTSLKKESRSSASESEVTEVTAEVHKSPEATRKSIMKYGVPVLPSPVANGHPRIVSFNTPDDVESRLAKHEKRLKAIKEDVANLEIRISEFVGKKDGRHYNNLKTSLTQLVEELEQIDEDELLDQVVLCHNYIKSCFSFLDSKAVDSDDIDDEVFTNYTDSKIYGSTHDLLEDHCVRTTAI
ncbi:hypothetical protein WA026_001460 [Henosepilachna vigintioctopunctata]|uniref:Uncharacterized protein n=1 Tax=Henosepilachna vigintioctopunctata TaxID=420089 RepID=A0AAW1UTX0_9CUCU